MALTQPEIDQARNWINTQWGTKLDPATGTQVPDSPFAGGGSSFDMGSLSNNTRNMAVLGAGQAMGYTPSDLSQILGQTPENIQAYQQKFAPVINMQSSIFQADNPLVAQQQAAQVPAQAQQTNPATGAPPPGLFGPAAQAIPPQILQSILARLFNQQQQSQRPLNTFGSPLARGPGNMPAAFRPLPAFGNQMPWMPQRQPFGMARPPQQMPSPFIQRTDTMPTRSQVQQQGGLMPALAQQLGVPPVAAPPGVTLPPNFAPAPQSSLATAPATAAAGAIGPMPRIYTPEWYEWMRKATPEQRNAADASGAASSLFSG